MNLFRVCIFFLLGCEACAKHEQPKGNPTIFEAIPAMLYLFYVIPFIFFLKKNKEGPQF
jgi:hypothetical protein